MANGKKAVTLRHIAEEAGVSQSTVSVILNNNGDKYRISKDTQARVLSVAKKLQFKPGTYLRRSAADSVIGDPMICVFWEAHFYHGPLKEFFEGLTRYKKECGTNYEFAVHPYEGGNLSSMRRIIDLGIYQGIIVTGLSEKDEEFIMSVDTKAPIVVFNRDTSNLNAVYIDNYSVGQRAAKSLLNGGTVSMVCVNPLIMHKNPGIRYAGFFDTCVKSGFPYNKIHTVYEENTHDGGYAAAEKIINAAQAPFGAFVSGDMMLSGFVKCLRNHGFTIPGDAVIVAYGNDSICEILTPTITGICPPTSDMGYDCIHMIDQSLRGISGNGSVKKHDCILTYRESCPGPADL